MSCWVCFATDEDDRTAEWVRPCHCRGSTKWVHQACLQRWVDEKQRGNSTARVACPQCNAEYRIVFPKLGPVVYVLDLADRLISKAGPFAAAGIMVGSIYWTAVTYGAVTVMQVVGHKEGLDVMERADPLFLLIGLPTIPVMLILGKMIRWEDYVLRLWRKYSNKLQILNSIFPGRDAHAHGIGCPVPRIPAEASPLADHVSATRILCGALVFPTIATIVGKLMFSSVNSNLQRTILGGIAFVAIKGAFKVYFKQQQYLRQAHRGRTTGQNTRTHKRTHTHSHTPLLKGFGVEEDDERVSQTLSRKVLVKPSPGANGSSSPPPPHVVFNLPTLK
uniref:E3 ubiquitin-protein ligase MARCHF5 n=1 Tax=Scophthalmus maximus TaxID=52904 RepID=A0A8D3CRW4_SCOMX